MWLGGFGDLLVVASSSPVSGLLEGELGFYGLELGSGSCESTGVGECAGILHGDGGADGIGCCYRYIERISNGARDVVFVVALYPAPLRRRVSIVLRQVGRGEFVPSVLPPFGNLVAVKRPLVVFEPCRFLAAFRQRRLCRTFAPQDPGNVLHCAKAECRTLAAEEMADLL